VIVPVITIDGPSGSGKGTVARRLADALGFHLLDSGALYRVTGHAGWLAGLSPTDADGHATLATGLNLRFTSTADGGEVILLDGVDIAPAIRTEEGGARASAVAALPPVRAALMALQKSFVRAPGLVADGRDMGTVVFPGAVLKIFLTASAEERARRRYLQLKNKGLEVDIEALSKEIAERDYRDAHRSASPLVPAADAVQLDSTDMSADAVLGEVLRLARERIGTG
jgi:cytidylate kinase